MPILKLAFLGIPHITYDDAEIELDRRKALALLAYLAVIGKRQSRDLLATMLWPNHDNHSARASLRRALAALNETPIKDWISADRDTIALVKNTQLWVDVDVFHALLEDGPATAETLNQAVALYRDHFMSGFSLRDSAMFDDWQSILTQNLQEKLVKTLEKLAQLYISKEDLDSAVQTVKHWLTVDILSETAQQLLIKLYVVSGQRSAALRQYEIYTRQLADELSAAPSPETLQLYEAIKNNQPISLDSAEKRIFGNLPPLPTLVIGREETLAEIKQKLIIRDSTGEDSLLVIQGWPGIGKTTFMSLLVHDQDIHQHFSNGILWTSLGEFPNMLSELTIWAKVLGLGELGAITLDALSARLRAEIQNKHMLLIIDDVWDIEKVLPFKIAGKNCFTIITTRMNDVAQSLSSRPGTLYKLPILSEANSLALLKTLAPEVVEQHFEEAQTLIQDLEGLPLAIQVAGRLLHAEMSMGWGISDLLAELREGTKLLSAQAPADRIEIANTTPPTVAVLLQRSTNRLEASVRQMFALLGVFAPRPATFDIEAIKAVWSVKDPKPAIRQLVSRGLLDPIGAGRFQMHALLAMHARSMFGN